MRLFSLDSYRDPLNDKIIKERHYEDPDYHRYRNDDFKKHVVMNLDNGG